MQDRSQFFDEATNSRMRQMFESLPERDKRIYAAVEAYKPGSPGVRAMARFFGISTETIKHGKDNLDYPENLPEPGRQRHKGAGRKGVFTEQPKLEAAFDTLIESHLGGDPMNADVVWTDLQPSGIAAALVKQGFSISETTVRVTLKKRNPQAQARKIIGNR